VHLLGNQQLQSEFWSDFRFKNWLVAQFWRNLRPSYKAFSLPLNLFHIFEAVPHIASIEVKRPEGAVPPSVFNGFGRPPHLFATCFRVNKVSPGGAVGSGLLNFPDLEGPTFFENCTNPMVGLRFFPFALRQATV
jgi:hypothetical protein